MNQRKSVLSALPIVAAHYGENLGVSVQVMGNEAYSTDRDSIVIPSISEDFPNEILWGYLAHEAAHVRYTNYKRFGEVAESDGINSARHCIFNTIEDMRIENLICETFPGVTIDLDATMQYLKVQGGMQSPSSDMPPIAILHGFIMLTLRDKYLGQDLADLSAEVAKVFRTVFPEGVFTRLSALMREISAVKTTDDALELTDRILVMLEEEKEKCQSPSANQPDSSGDEAKGQGNKSSDGTDKSSSDQQPGDSSNGDGKADGEGQSGEPGKPGQPGDGSKSDSQAGKPGGNDSTEQGSSSDQNSGNGSGDGSQPNMSDQVDQKPGEQSNGKGQSGVKGQPGELNISEQDAGAKAIQEALSPESKHIPADTFNSLKEKLEDSAAKNPDKFTTGVPKATPAKGSYERGQAMLANATQNSSKLRGQLYKLVQSSQRTMRRTKRSGRKLQGSKLCRIASGDTRVFKASAEKVAPNTSIFILTDLSSSMQSMDARIAKDATMAIALAIEPIKGVDSSISYFMGNDKTPVKTVKKFDERVKNCLDRFDISSNGSTPLAQGLWHALFELYKQKTNRKIIIVVTDGKPNANQQTDCAKLVKRCHASDIETIGIGIRTDSVKDYFERHIVIDSVDELQGKLFQVVKDKLVAPAA